MPRGVADPNRANRCVHTKNGHRCKKSAINGATVCKSHGAAAPQVQRSARARFNDSIDPMLNMLADMEAERKAGTLTPEDRRFFMKFVADRTGFIPGKAIDVEVTVKPWEAALQGIIREMSSEDVIDAEVVEDEADALERHKREEADRRRIAEEDDARDRARSQLLQFRTDRTREPVRVGSSEPPREGR